MDEIAVFEALDYHDFAKQYLVENNQVRGSLAKRATEINRENTKDANRWASEIFNDVRRGLEDLGRQMAKKGRPVDQNEDHNSKSSEHKIYNLNGQQVQLKIYRIGSWANEEVPIVDVIISPRRKIEINIYDDESIMVKMSPSMARRMNLNPMMVIKRVDRVGPYIVGILEKQLWR